MKETEQAKKHFVDCVKNLRWTGDDAEVRVFLTRALIEAWDRPSKLAGAAASLVIQNPEIGQAMHRAVAAWPRQLSGQELFGMNGAAAIAADPLLHALLISGPICGNRMERFLTMARSAMLDEAVGTTQQDGDVVPNLNFYAALARQCFINEYVFACDDEQIRKVTELRGSLIAALDTKIRFPILWLVAVAAYYPLGSLPQAGRLMECRWPDEITVVLVQQIVEPAKEAKLRDTIPRLTDIGDGVSRLVQVQYEENPYPRWVKDATENKPKAIDIFLRQLFPLAAFEPFGQCDAPQILIAGCGTGQHPIGTALRIRDAQVLAVDLSMASLAYAKRKTLEIGLNSIDYAQADLLRLGALGRMFDVIESVGVLHHLADPLAGWRVLLSLLRPGGFMFLAFYSQVARRNITKARAFLAEGGYGSTNDEIRRARQDLVNLEENAEFKAVTTSSDFFSTSNCRDMLFHVQEHGMTLEVINNFIEENNMLFFGFEIDRSVINSYKRRFPNDLSACSLSQWSVFEKENPDTFLGMYQFWVQKAP